MPDMNDKTKVPRSKAEYKKLVSELEEAVSARKRAEEELHEQMNFSQTLLQASPAFFVAISADGKTIMVNETMLRALGYEQEEVVGKDYMATFVPERDREELSVIFEKLVTSKGPTLNENYILARDGRELLVEWHGRTVFNEEGEFEYFFGVGIDITERKQAEAALSSSEERHRMFFESAPIGIIHYNNKGIVTESNDVAILTFGSSRDKLIGLDINDLPNKKFLKEINKALEGKRGHYEGVYTSYTGKKKAYIKAEWFPIFYDGKVTGGVGIVADISEQIKLEAQLRQAQKMESIGRLAGGVAHDFNNMLGVILGHAEMALVQMDSTNPLYSHMTEIRTAAERSADLTRQLLAFARKQTIAPRPLDLNRTVSGMLKMLRRLIGENIDLAFLPGTDLWPVNMDPAQIDQIMANLCVNARDSIDGVGNITIETKNATTDEAYCAGHPGFFPGDYVLLTLSDTGCGMDNETKRYLFEPFFTTKEVGKGIGLGLAMLYGIVKQNNGFIDVYSEPDQGTIFKIYLPRHTARATAIQKEGPEEPAIGGHETILLVEDEISILQLITIMLEHQGYIVMAASTPGEAISLAEAHPGEIDLLITDVVMPEMNGGDLATKLVSFYPNLKSLFMSGYTANVIAHHGVLDEGVYFIQKPFRNQDLAARVREALDSE